MFPELFSWGFIHVRSWGVLIAVAFLVVMSLISASAKKIKLMTPDDVLEGGIIAIFCGVLGARIAFVVEYWPLFKSDWKEILMIQHGGLVFYGGLFLALISLVVWARARKFSLIKILDITAPAMLIGIGIGRIGCFLNGCCYGKLTTHPWGRHFLDVPGIVHPTQLYEFMGAVALGLLAYALGRVRKFNDGQMLGLCFIFYGVLRFGIELLRVNPVYYSLSSAQWISLGLMAGGICLFFYGRRRPQ